MKNKLTWKDIRPKWYGYNGFEIYIDERSNKLQFPDGMTPQERKNARLVLKGMKYLAKTLEITTLEKLAGSFHGNLNNIRSKYEKLLKIISKEDLIKLGMNNTKKYSFQLYKINIMSYVDGSYTYNIEKNGISE